MLPISDSMLIRRLDLGRRPICHSLIHRGYVQHRGFGVGAPHLSGSDAGLLSSLTSIMGTPQLVVPAGHVPALPSAPSGG